MKLLLHIRGLSKSYRKKRVLYLEEFLIPEASITGIIGPDGAGKSTLLKIISGVLSYQGSVAFREIEIKDSPDRIKARLSYMPQGIGYNLYMDLTVQENIYFFGKLRGISEAVLKENARTLLEASGLWPHRDKLASHLSGGMKQKLGLACSLVSEPELLVLDEPSTGIDPLSRRQLWQVLTERLKSGNTTVVFATSYMDEAERADHLLFLNEGEVLFQGPTLEALGARMSLEEAFFESLSRTTGPAGEVSLPPEPQRATTEEPIQVKSLRKTFGETEALKGVDLHVMPAEVFGLLGPNGAGKTTLLRCLLGLERPDEGEISVAGLKPGTEELRYKVGYMSQIFSLYGDLTVRENILLYGRLYRVPKELLEKRLKWVLEFSGLSDYEDHPVRTVPLGMKQRLGLGVATIHMPQVLFLDEPTSGVDPLTRRLFWRFIKALSEQLNITVLVTTHNLIEADFCDRVAIMNERKIVVLGGPEELKKAFQQRHGQVFELKTDRPLQLDSLSERGIEAVAFGRRYHIWGKEITENSLRKVLQAQGLQIEYLRPIAPPMEDIFIEAVKG